MNTKAAQDAKGKTAALLGGMMDWAANLLSSGELSENRSALRRAKNTESGLRRQLNESREREKECRGQVAELRNELSRTKLRQGHETMLEMVRNMLQKPGEEPGAKG